jgi:DNA-binding SARP family transcriptional activator
MSLLRLALFGGFEATLASGTRVVLPTKKSQALLAYCALRSDQAHQREKVATLLWGETGEANARNSLRQTLYVLRSALGENLSRVLRIERDAIGADPRAIDVDVLSFERLAAERTPQSLEQAAALYRGDLLDGFVVDEEPFEEWLLQEREKLRDLAMEALARLLQHQRVEGTAMAAIQTARHLLALDPLQEIVHRLLMHLFLQVGRPDEALNQYQFCSRVLKRELNLEPEGETTQLRDTIVGGLRSAAQGRNGDSLRHGPLEAALSGLNGLNGGSGSGAVASPLRVDGEAGFSSLHAAGFKLKRVLEETQRALQESRERRILLRRAFKENSQHIIAIRQLLLEDGRLGAASMDVADPV